MNDLNQFTGIGRLGADPESRTMPDGKPVANFRIAMSEHWKDKTTGEKKERTEWLNICAFGPLADLCKTYLKKGHRCCITGQIRTRKWTDKDDAVRYTTEVIAYSVQFLEKKDEQQKPTDTSSQRETDSPDEEPDLPF